MQKTIARLFTMILMFSLVSCATFGSVAVEPCPNWSELSGQCKTLWGSTQDRYVVDMEKWTTVRLDVGGRMMVNSAENISFFTEDGVEVDPETQLFTTGVYIARVIDGTKSAYFVMDNTESSTRTFTANMLFVRLEPATPTP